MRRGYPGPLTSAQVRQGGRCAHRPATRSGLPPAPPPDQVKRGIPLCGRAMRSGVPAPRSRRGTVPAAPLLPDAHSPAVLRPPSEKRWNRRLRAPLGARRDPRGAARCVGRVTPPWPPPGGAGLAGGRRRQSRPTSAGPGVPQISAHFCSGRQGSNFAPRSIPVLRPQGWAESFLNR